MEVLKTVPGAVNSLEMLTVIIIINIYVITITMNLWQRQTCVFCLSLQESYPTQVFENKKW